MATSQKASWTSSNPPTHECTENGRPEKERIPFYRVEGDRKKGREPTHERMRDLPSLNRLRSLIYDLMRFQKNAWYILNTYVYLHIYISREVMQFGHLKAHHARCSVNSNIRLPARCGIMCSQGLKDEILLLDVSTPNLNHEVIIVIYLPHTYWKRDMLFLYASSS